MTYYSHLHMTNRRKRRIQGKEYRKRGIKYHILPLPELAQITSSGEIFVQRIVTKSRQES